MCQRRNQRGKIPLRCQHGCKPSYWRDLPSTLGHYHGRCRGQSMNARLALSFVFLATTLSSETNANEYRCDEPRGMRAEHGDLFALDGSHILRADDGVKWADDGFSGVFPSVSVRSHEIVIAWENSVPEDIKGLVDSGARVYRIPISGRDSISVWGVRMQSSTAEIWRFYENYRTLYLLQSTIGLSLQGMNMAPSQAAIYVAHCLPS